ncbi:MAG: nucleotidyltransferase family protein [Bacteroidetes bacterium]|nr:nucleotidyltransferase family protein [Bacteroidota bacterium]
MIDISLHKLSNTSSIKECLVRLNELNGNPVFVVNDRDKVLGTVTDGDIRRGLLEELSLSESVEKIMHTSFRFIQEDEYSVAKINAFKEQQIYFFPILDHEGRIVKLLDLHALRSVLPVEVVIMAGGRGERLRPLTDETPKPLLKVGGKPIIEHNIDRLALYGIEKISISVKYKAEQIEAYLQDGSSKGLNIQYIHEDKPLGTLGSVGLIQTITSDAILVMNSDLLTNIDFEDFYKFFIEKDADMAVASIPYRVEIPYGVLETKGDQIKSLREKPSYTYYSNAGIYLIKKSFLKHIPKGEHYNATDLMDQLMKDGNSLVNYPIIHYWLDIGKHEDYIKAQEDIKHIQF